MSARQENPLVFTQMRGRDGSTASTLTIPQHKALEAVNVNTYRAGFARKRNGSDALFATSTGEAFTGVISSLLSHAVSGAWELWGVDSAATPVVQRMANGLAWTTPTLVDNVATQPFNVIGASLNGKLFLAYDSDQSRLHVWDPTSNKVRRCGLSTPAAPTAANTGSGSYAATERHYKVAYAVLDGSGNIRYRSELSAKVSFTPSGSGTHARVTKPASITEDETHWLLYASADDTIYHLIATTVVGTTTYDDNTAPASYTGDAPPLAGTHTPWHSVRYIVSTGNQLVGARGWETGVPANRVYYSAFTGQFGDLCDEEYVPQTSAVSNYVDLAENDGSLITGLGLLGGRPIVFKQTQMWQLIPTGLDNPVFRAREIYKGSGVGCIRHQFIVNAEDEAGRPCVYFCSETGPYRYGTNGLIAMVDDIQDIWDTMNLGATTHVGMALFYPAKKQVWWWLATGANNEPDKLLVFDIRQGRVNEQGRIVDGWYQYTGNIAGVRCASLFREVASGVLTANFKPYVGRSSGTTILMADSSTATDDAGTDFQAYVDLPDRHFAGLGRMATLGQTVLVGSAGSQSLRVTVTPNYGEITGRTTDVSMAAAGSETRALRKAEGSAYGDRAYAHRIRVGDAAASDAQWVIDAVVVPWEAREDTTQ